MAFLSWTSSTSVPWKTPMVRISTQQSCCPEECRCFVARIIGTCRDLTVHEGTVSTMANTWDFAWLPTGFKTIRDKNSKWYIRSSSPTTAIYASHCSIHAACSLVSYIQILYRAVTHALLPLGARAFAQSTSGPHVSVAHTLKGCTEMCATGGGVIGVGRCDDTVGISCQGMTCCYIAAIMKCRIQ